MQIPRDRLAGWRLKHYGSDDGESRWPSSDDLIQIIWLRKAQFSI
jgi:hypothetical protein